MGNSPEQFTPFMNRGGLSTEQILQIPDRLRTFAEAGLKLLGNKDQFIVTAVNFASAVFDADKGLEDPGRHQRIGEEAKKLGLSDEDIKKANQTGTDVVVVYRHLVDQQAFPFAQLTPGAIELLKQRERVIRRHERRGSKPSYTGWGRGSDPHWFLGDGSGRRDLGYIQSQQEPKD